MTLCVTLLLVACGGDEQKSECDSVITFEGLHADEIAVAATALGETASAPVPRYPGFAGVEAEEVVAYRFVVRTAGWQWTRPPMPPRRGVLAAGDTFWAVPWAHDMECAPRVWNESDWVPAGADAVFRVTGNRMWEGEAVIDVFGWYWPYPWGTHVVDDAAPEASSEPDDWLDPQDFMRMIWALPTLDPELDRSDQLTRIENAFRGNPQRWIDRFPGREVIRRARRWAAEDLGGR